LYLPTLEEKRKESIDFLVALSVTSDNLEYQDGVPVDNAEEFRKMYTDEDISWIRDQVSQFTGETTNFIKRA